jgi:hypothetical protein
MHLLALQEMQLLLLYILAPSSEFPIKIRMIIVLIIFLLCNQSSDKQLSTIQNYIGISEPSCQRRVRSDPS